MYLTVLKADYESLSNREYFVDMKDGNFMHKWLTSQFHTSRADSQILYRTKFTKQAAYLYVQSTTPFPEKNIKRAGFIKALEFTPEASDEQIYFNILTTPCKKDNETQKIVYADDNIEWLQKKLSPFMDIAEIREIRKSKMTIKNGVNIWTSEFEGKGTITDINLFNETVANGIGRHKNYGQGLFLFHN